MVRWSEPGSSAPSKAAITFIQNANKDSDSGSGCVSVLALETKKDYEE